VLRETGFVRVRPAGTVRLYAADPDRLREADDWIAGLRSRVRQRGPAPVGSGLRSRVRQRDLHR